jgi:hypothetical protein
MTTDFGSSVHAEKSRPSAAHRISAQATAALLGRPGAGASVRDRFVDISLVAPASILLLYRCETVPVTVGDQEDQPSLAGSVSPVASPG